MAGVVSIFVSGSRAYTLFGFLKAWYGMGSGGWGEVVRGSNFHKDSWWPGKLKVQP